MDIKKTLSTIQKKQEENNQRLTEQKRLEEQLEAFYQREERLLGWLYDVWRKDKELRISLEHDRLELQHEHQKIARKLHDNTQDLNNEKLNLLNEEEEELTALRRSIMLEEKS